MSNNTLLTKEDLSFTASALATEAGASAGQNKYYFDLDPQGKPIKIGDGTFGAVFAVRNESDQPLALKIFYKLNTQGYGPDSGDPATQAAHQRFEDEMGATRAIRAKLPPEAGALPGLVLPMASTKAFSTSNAGKNLIQFFDSINLSVSDYALVMERYQCTLKHLLEIGRPANPAADSEILIQPAKMGGYNILRHLQQKPREQFIAWVIRQIIPGLRTLHRAELRHHDIKPSNVLLRCDVAGGLQVALGDFGFLRPSLAFSPAAGTAVPSIQAGLPLGTRHYRSAEQRDYFDICEVDVQPTAEYPLTTEDPKFRDSLMEKGDILVFSKDKNFTRYNIEEIKFSDKQVQIKVSNGTTLKADRRTQVSIYKRQTIRTDIFGVGSLIFDMLTCGKSPERFYDFIRRWDRTLDKQRRVEDDTAVIGIHELVAEYRQRYYTHVPGSSAEVSSVLDELRYDRQKSYPSPHIVDIIFRCILARAAGSYLSGLDVDNVKDVPKVYEKLESSLVELGSIDRMMTAKENPLWLGEIPDTSLPVADMQVENDLRTLQQISNPVQRLEEAYVLMDPIVSLLFAAASQNHDQTGRAVDYPYYADMSPANIQLVRSNHGYAGTPKDVIFRTKREYEKALEDYTLGLVSGSLQKPFMPVYMSALIRNVYLAEVKADPNNKTQLQAEQGIVSVQYLDSSPFWFGYDAGDYLLIRKGGTEVLKLNGKGNIIVAKNSFGKSATLVKRLLPVEYYLATLGIYIHQCFFVDRFRDFGELPKVMQLALEISSISDHDLKNLNSAIITDTWAKVTPDAIHVHINKYKEAASLRQVMQKEAADQKAEHEKKGIFYTPKTLPRTNPVEHCYRTLAVLYVWLTGLYFRRKNRELDPSEHVAQVKTLWERLGNDIATACGHDGTHAMRAAIQSPTRKERNTDAQQATGSIQIPTLGHMISKSILG